EHPLSAGEVDQARIGFLGADLALDDDLTDERGEGDGRQGQQEQYVQPARGVVMAREWGDPRRWGEVRHPRRPRRLEPEVGTLLEYRSRILLRPHFPSGGTRVQSPFSESTELVD